MRPWSFFVVVSFAFSQAAQDPTDAQGWINKAVASVQAGNRMEAANALSAALELDPDNLRALNTLAWLQFTSHAFDELRSTCEKILTLVPDSKEAHQGLAAVMAEAVETARMGVRSKAGMKPDQPGQSRTSTRELSFRTSTQARSTTASGISNGFSRRIRNSLPPSPL